MKFNLTILFALLLCLLALGCARRETADIVALSVPQQMREHKIEFLGDAPGVGRLVGMLPAMDENYHQNMFALQTSEEPFGLTIYYEPSPSWDRSDMVVADEMKEYAGYLFECVNNLGYVEYAYRASPSVGELVPEEYTTVYRADRE